ncbi:hypothetical protein PH586_16565 [Pseudomonas sp. SA3-5]|uniref:PXPV repeat-containing protein n=1 Tax=Pseudomonas aestuarii TaxID=3018340 RepID=A0ABT4XIH7_9PSED|nr:hypothetical protein [Pseudomonas aestuarii]MDA7088005.1 hypothetical protein [Pseudomonas aestuarii]
MIARIPILAVLVASLALAGEASARGSDHNAVIAGAVVGAVVGGAIVAGSRHDRVPVYVEIGAPPPVYYDSYPRYHQPPPVYYRPYTVVVEPRYQYRSGHKFRHHNRHHYRNDRYRRHQRHNRDYYAPRW